MNERAGDGRGAETGLPHAGPLLTGGEFWRSPSIDELAARQVTSSGAEIDELLGGWPGELDDGFEEEIRRARQTGLIGERP
jgi:hypothetical protein